MGSANTTLHGGQIYPPRVVWNRKGQSGRGAVERGRGAKGEELWHRRLGL